MFKHRFPALLPAIIGSLLTANPAAAQMEIPESAHRLEPAVPWTVDFAEHSCAVRRVFGGEDQQVYVEMRQFSPGGLLQLIVASDDFGRRLRNIETTFMPDTSPDDEHQGAMPLSTTDFGEGFVTQVTLLSSSQIEVLRQESEAGIFYGYEDEDVYRREAEIEGLLIENAFRRPLYLQTGSMHDLMNVMRQCMDSLIASWGLDLEAHQTLTRYVQPRNMEIWSRALSERYPRSQLRNGEQAVVRIRLMVSSDGTATDCVIQNSMNEEEFDELACELLLENARFDPALDANGDPMDSFWVTSVIYRIG